MNSDSAPTNLLQSLQYSDSGRVQRISDEAELLFCVVIMCAAARLSGVLCLAVASAFTGPAVRTHARLAQPLRVESDVNWEGHTVVEEAPPVPRSRDSVLKPHPSLTALEVVEEQLSALSTGAFSDIEDAFTFLSPKIVEYNEMDASQFKKILESATFDGILGCKSWEVKETVATDDTHLAVTLKIQPKPLPIGCTCFRCSVSGLSDLAEMPLYFKWEMTRQTTGPYDGCWMLEQMSPGRAPRGEEPSLKRKGPIKGVASIDPNNWPKKGK